MKKLIYSQEDLNLVLSLETEEKDKEIERLNKELDKTRLSELNKEYIIYELEKWLKEDLKQVYRDAGHRHNLILEVLDKLHELKGSGSNE